MVAANVLLDQFRVNSADVKLNAAAVHVLNVDI